MYYKWDFQLDLVQFFNSCKRRSIIKRCHLFWRTRDELDVDTHFDYSLAKPFAILGIFKRILL